MAAASIELNDAGVAVFGDGALVTVSPGFALVNRDPPLLGAEARAAARVEPLATQFGFWSELSQDPLRSHLAAGRSAADLAYHHLLQLTPALRPYDTLVAVVAASMGEAQLALTLGIARACELSLSGFADAATVAATAVEQRGPMVHVDLNLSHAIITAVEVGDVARRGRFEAIPRAGLEALHESWLAMIGRRFVADTRFDPLHDGRNEQALFDALPEWLARLSKEESLTVEMEFGEDHHRVDLSREEFALEAQAVIDNIVARVRRLRRAGQRVTLLLSDRAANLPGLRERLAEFHDSEILACPPGTAAAAAAAHAAQWSANEDGATLLRSLPMLEPGALGAFAPQALMAAQPLEPPPAPTHLLYRGQAHLLRPEPLVIGLAPGVARSLQVVGTRAGISRVHCSIQSTPAGAINIDHSRYGTWVNDESVAGRAPLYAGDRVRIGNPGVTLDLIALE
jgi:hypothetical protein